MTETPSDSKQKDRKSRRGRTLLGVGGVALILLLVAWWRYTADKPVIQIPTPIMPSPNAFDYYVAAGRNRVNVKQINAAQTTKADVALSLEQKEALVHQNAAALQSLRQGFAFEYRHPPIRSITGLMPEYAGFRDLARLLLLQSEALAARGDWGGAAESALDAIRLGEDIPRGDGLIGRSNGHACEQIGQRALWSTIEHLSASQARSAIQRLQTILDRHVPYADTIQEEKWTYVATFQSLFRQVDVKGAFQAADAFGGEKPSFSQRMSTVYYLLYGKQQALRSYAEYMDAVTAGVQKPYALKMLPPPRPTDPISQLLAPDLSYDRTSNTAIQAKNGLALVALALRAYRLEKGRYPATLAELAPTYLKKLPEDPFAAQGMLLYRLQGQNYLLYSIGPDGKDDGGRPIDNPRNATARSPQTRYTVKSDSFGDIVSGVNTP